LKGGEGEGRGKKWRSTTNYIAWWRGIEGLREFFGCPHANVDD